MSQDLTEAVNSHYGRGNLVEVILKALQEAGKDLKALSIDDLALIEEFHIGGREATLALARLAKLTAKMRVVDVGCGIGGPARALAHYFGCSVSGVDLNREFCVVAALLTDRTGLSNKVMFRWGSALDLPLPDASFDVAWMQHVTMNIQDMLGLFREVARVLRPNGRLAFYEILSGDRPIEHFPVPWARDPSLSFLSGIDDIQVILESSGFELDEWQDVTDESADWFRQVLSKAAADGPPLLSLATLMGPEFPLMAGNVSQNLEEARLRVVRGVCTLRK